MVKDNGERYFLEVDVQSPEILHDNPSNLFFFFERMRIETVEKRVMKFHRKEFKVINFNQETGLKP